MRKKLKKQPRFCSSKVIVAVVLILFLTIVINIFFLDRVSKQASINFNPTQLLPEQEDALSPYPEVRKLVDEGDVSYEDALVMVGLKKPSGESSIGGYPPGGSKNGATFDYGPEVRVGEHNVPVANDPEVKVGRPGPVVGNEEVVKVRRHDAPGGREPVVETGERDAQRLGAEQAKEVDADRRGVGRSRESEDKASEQDIPTDREVNNHEAAAGADGNDSAGGNEAGVEPDSKDADEEEIVVVEPKESVETKRVFIRRAKTEPVKKRKHADHVLASILTDDEIDLEIKLSASMKDIYHKFALARSAHSFTIKTQSGDGDLMCLDYIVDEDKRKNGPLNVFLCHDERGDIASDSTQAFILDNKGILKSNLRYQNSGMVPGCLSVVKKDQGYELTESKACGKDDTESHWEYKESTGILKHKATDTCVTPDFQVDQVRMLPCSDQGDNVRWHLKRLPLTAILKDDPEGIKPETRDFAFNSYASMEIGPYRPIKDNRPKQCATSYRPGHDPEGKKLSKKASVIFCFYNEEWFALIRSVWSSIITAPAHLIEEVILVDDGSYLPWLLEPLEEYLEAFKHVIKARVVRAPKRDGLITARLLGAEHARGDVLVFLDSHVEPTPGWLEPFVWSIENDRKTVICPNIPTTTWQDLKFEDGGGGHSIGIFDWSLTFTWRVMTEEESSGLQPNDPFNSPTMAGGLFAIERDYFYEIGSYDPQMKMWGGENLEISFRIWMCGGKLIIHPCSKFFHIYRKHVGRENDRVGNYLQINNNRLAEVWMDNYKQIYYAGSPKLSDSVVGDLTDRKKLRERLKCKDFKWFLDTMMKKMFIPDADHALCMGAIRNPHTNLCLDTYSRKDSGRELQTFGCHGEGGNQAWWFTKGHEIRTMNENCVDIFEGPGQTGLHTHLESCHGSEGNQRLDHDGYPGHPGLFKHYSDYCLQANAQTNVVDVGPCDKSNPLQLWICTDYPQHGK